MKTKNRVSPPQAGVRTKWTLDAALAEEVCEALAALCDEAESIAIRHGYGYEGSNFLEVMSDARLALRKARGESLPPVAAKQKRSGMSPAEAFSEGQKILKERQK